METPPSKSQGPDLATLVREIVLDSEALIDQQLRLFRSEVRGELAQATGAALAIGAGAGLVATAGVLSTLMLVHAIHKSTRLPLWGCYGLVGGILGATGAGFLAIGRNEARDVHLLPPPQTAEALKENLAWLKEQLTQEAT